MKKMILFVLFSVLLFSLFAQKGMFDISYNQSAVALNKILLSKGFKVEKTSSNNTTYSNPKIPNLNSLQVFHSGADSLIFSWTINYQVNNNQTLIDK